jgi:hypothetical protein
MKRLTKNNVDHPAFLLSWKRLRDAEDALGMAKANLCEAKEGSRPALEEVTQ